MSEPTPTQKKKKVFHNGILVGEIDASDDPQIEIMRSEAVINALGIRTEPPTELKMFNHAAAFTHASAHIYATLLTDPAQMARGAAPFVVNSTFATELYLKALVLIYGKKSWGHKLVNLFQCLPKETQERLQGDYAKFAQLKQISYPIPLNNLLNTNNQAFEKWRYSYETPSTGMFHIPETISFMEALHKLGSELLTNRPK